MRHAPFERFVMLGLIQYAIVQVEICMIRGRDMQPRVSCNCANYAADAWPDLEGHSGNKLLNFEAEPLTERHHASIARLLVKYRNATTLIRINLPNACW